MGCVWGLPRALGLVAWVLEEKGIMGSYSLRDTWMSSVTLNTPEVTKLSWKSVVSAAKRKLVNLNPSHSQDWVIMELHLCLHTL